MKLFVTGSESFVGRECIRQALAQRIDVVGIDLVPNPSQEYEFYQADIKSRAIADRIPESADALVHLAALSRDTDCKNNAYACFDTNVMGTLNLIEAAKKKNVKQFIFASSEWVYDGFPNGLPRDEESSINPFNLESEYAFSKLVSEINLKQQYSRGFCDVIILRFGIIYGPRPSNWSAVETLFSQVKNNIPITVGSLRTARRFIHISDIARSVIQSIGLHGFHKLNVCGDTLVSLDDIIQESASILEKTPTVQEVNPGNESSRNPSNRKACDILSWEQKVNLHSGLSTLDVPAVHPSILV